MNQEIMERKFHASRRKVYKKISTQLKWNGEIFESKRALARRFKMISVTTITSAIKKGIEWNGHKIEVVR